MKRNRCSFGSVVGPIPVLFVLLSFLYQPGTRAQMHSIHGVVADDEGRLLPGILVSDTASKVRTFTNYNGEFFLELFCLDSCDLIVSGSGYAKKRLRAAPGQFITVILEETEARDSEFQHKTSGRSAIWGYNTWVGADFMEFDFNAFEPVIGPYNTKALNTYSPVIAFSFGPDIRNVYTSFQFGFGGGEKSGDEFPDSLSFEVNQTFYGIHAGYHMINSNRVLLTPMAGLKWYRFRLIRSVAEHRIDFEDYLEDPSLDIRFNQLAWFAGLMVQYKFRDEMASGWTFGGYFGYLGRVNGNPWVYTTSNRLNTARSIGVGPWNFGIFMGFYIK